MVLRLIGEQGGDAEAFLADVGQYAEAGGLVAGTLSRFGRLDILVNNAGVLTRYPLLDVPLTEINLPLYQSDRPEDIQKRTAVLHRVPWGEIDQPEDIGRAVAFQASDAARYITGAGLYVDGGYTADGTPRLPSGVRVPQQAAEPNTLGSAAQKSPEARREAYLVRTS